MRVLLSPLRVLWLLIILFVGWAAYYSAPGIRLRNHFYTPPPELHKVFKRFQWLQKRDEAEPVPLPIVYEGRGPGAFSIELATQPLHLQKQQVVMRNPFATEPYPLSYSVIYRGHLVTLFAPGRFACYQLPDLKRNQAMEQRLNTRQFAYHWILDEQLVVLSGGQFYCFTEDERWQPYRVPVPLGKQPKLFEDARYVVCIKCNGEWGGEAYFYDKVQRTYYIAQATCPTAAFKLDGRYFILSSLAHMMGHGDLQRIDNPTQLTRWRGKIKPQDRDFGDYSARVSHGSEVFAYPKVLLLSCFTLWRQPVFLVRWRNTAFLATWHGGTFRVVDGLFHSDLYAHDPVTTKYSDNTVLINLGSYEDGERSYLLLLDNKITHISWSPEEAPREYSTSDTFIQQPRNGEVLDSTEAQLLE